VPVFYPNASLAPDEMVILKYLENHPGAGIMEIYDETGLSSETRFYYLSYLLANGIIAYDAENY